MRLKVCGLNDSDNCRKVAALKPDYIGFIFYAGSKRFVGENFIMPLFPPDIKKVGVFVDSSASYILEKVDQYQLDLIQLHGKEKPWFCEMLNHLIPVIKAFGVDDGFDLASLEPYKNCCSYFLFDTKTIGFGGSGQQFDWEKLEDYKLDVPFFLSGGIGLKEIEMLPFGKLKIHGIDVNSKFEIEPGIKDIKKLKKIKIK